MPPEEIRPSFFKILLRAVGWTLFFLFIFLLLTGVGLGIFAWQKANTFAQNAGSTIPELYQTAKTGWHTKPEQNDGHINFLILGTDNLANRGHAVALTDTMLVASLNTKTGNVSMYSIPRDLWIPDYKTKVNALYTYGNDRYPTEPQRFPREVLESMLGIKIHHTMILNLETLAQLIDTIGGIDVPIKEGFIDTQFPRPDVDVTTEHDPAKLYETVEFKTGIEHMSGDRVLEFVRSRHSTTDQGNDLARALRQQTVVFALINQLKQPRFYFDVARAGKLYAFYIQHFAQYLPITEMIGIGKSLYPVMKNIKFTVGEPSVFPDSPDGSIIHPPVSAKYQQQWVYEVKDPSQFQNEAKQKLGF